MGPTVGSMLSGNSCHHFSLPTRYKSSLFRTTTGWVMSEHDRFPALDQLNLEILGGQEPRVSTRDQAVGGGSGRE